MASNIDKYKADLIRLCDTGRSLLNSMNYIADKERYTKLAKSKYKDNLKDHIDSLPHFYSEYQCWYSESLALLKQVIPDRLDDFIYLYAKPKSRKELSYENYTIADFLERTQVTLGERVMVGVGAAVPKMQQQIAIVDSAAERFKSSLFDIKAMVQADLLDSEIDAARLLAKHKFFRAAGMIAGVILERHLSTVCELHNIPVTKKNPTIADFNELLKGKEVIDQAQWRFIQHLADIRNICGHAKGKEPGSADADDIIDGTSKVIKTIF